MSDLVADATAELYGADPDEFTARRSALATQARAAGEPEAAKRIGALRKPTRAAWLLNHLARTQPEVPAQLAELANGLRAAERARDGARLRELSAARSALTDEFTRRALDGIQDPPAGLREDVSATLAAAIADSSVAVALAGGTLTRAVRWAGFGGSAEPDSTDLTSLFAPPSVGEPEKSGTSARKRPAVKAPAGNPTRGREPARSSALGEAEKQNRRRQQIQDAERVVANASALATTAAASEDRLEETVHGLEQRLTMARAELSEARLRARRAEAGERKARQALDRLRRAPQLPGVSMPTAVRRATFSVSRPA